MSQEASRDPMALKSAPAPIEYGRAAYEAWRTVRITQGIDSAREIAQIGERLPPPADRKVAEWPQLAPETQRAWNAFGKASLVPGMTVSRAYNEYYMEASGGRYPDGSPAFVYAYLTAAAPALALAWDVAWRAALARSGQ